jgi:hypothetical protein
VGNRKTEVKQGSCEIIHRNNPLHGPSYAERGRAPEAIIAPRMQGGPSGKSSKPRHTDFNKTEADGGSHYVSSAG